MNWFTKEYAVGMALSKKIKLIQKTDCACEHLETNPELLHVVSYECDSWGREGYAMCKACADKAQEEVDDEEVHCQDCHQPVKKKDSIEWRWYDFYAPQGDEPRIVCHVCVNKEEHQERVRRDQIEREQESSYYD